MTDSHVPSYPDLKVNIFVTFSLNFFFFKKSKLPNRFNIRFPFHFCSLHPHCEITILNPVLSFFIMVL